MPKPPPSKRPKDEPVDDEATEDTHVVNLAEDDWLSFDQDEFQPTRQVEVDEIERNKKDEEAAKKKKKKDEG